jgi:uncharacterized protein YbjQ (UPF0145 family)
VARARIARAAADGVRTSLLSADGLAGLEVAGFDVVGEVLGTAVMQIGWTGFGGCGWTPGLGGGGYYGPAQVSRPSRWSGYEPYVRAVRHGRDTALNRLLQEASALGADGVVGVKFTDERMEGQKREFMALGTAVRSRGRERPKTPFTTDLGGQDFAKLLSAGWVPAGLTYGIAMAVRHDDWRTQSQTGAWAGNTEVSGYTELITHVRADARRGFAAMAAKLGGDAALLSSLWSHAWPIEVAENHTDHVAECLVTGNAIARFHAGRKATTSSLTILPLRSSR